MSEWDDRQIAQLRALWAEEHSTAEIARRMGISKNAVVGKAHRLGLPARPSPIRAAVPGAAAAPKRVTPPKLAAPVPIAAIHPPVAVAVVARRQQPAPVPVVAAEPCTVFRPIKAGPCVYPMWGDGRPTHRYCDKPAGSSGYCPEHHAICWVKPIPMRLPMMAGRAA